MTVPPSLIPWLECQKCPLGAKAKLHVLGRGELPCNYIFLGEGPGKSEDVLGEAFIGRAGKLLDKAIALASMGKPRRIYFTNLVACRPTDKIGGPNRQPNGDEILACMPRLKETFCLSKADGLIVCGRLPELVYEKFIKGQEGFPVFKVLHVPHPSAIARRGGEKSEDWGKYHGKIGEFFRKVGL